MGMFDNILVNKDFNLPLPEDLGELTKEYIYNAEFQTKSLGRSLTKYHLREDGNIYEELVKWVDYEDSPFGGGIEPTGEFKQLEGNHVIEFYCYIQSDKFENDYCLDWEYVYTSDKKEIKLIKFDKKPNAERKARSKEWLEDLKRSNERRKKWHFKLYLAYEWVVVKGFRTYRKVMEKLPSNYRVERFLLPF